jgi:serine/threonine-protein kinase RsbW
MSSVTLTFPADTVNASLARSLAAAMAARADLPIDRLEDVRLAVDEALAQVLAGAPKDSPVMCRFTLDGDALEITVSGEWSPPAAPSTSSFGWMVMTALCDRVSTHLAEGTLALTLAVRRTVTSEA